ncbi:hypothetical protein [Poriferisphaera corsica]|nr:hypothetical protein [Poriferisphaera corsica]
MDHKQQNKQVISRVDFSEEELAKQLKVDGLLRWGSLAILGGVFVWFLLFGPSGQGENGGSGFEGSGLLMVLLIVGWFMLNSVNARTGRELGQISGLVDRDPGRVMVWAGMALKRKPLLKWVRLMIYHRLAMVRHRQGHYVESAAICRGVLKHGLGPAEGSRGHLLLIWAEASIELRDMTGAYEALRQLHGMRLSLLEGLQRLCLQIRYEVIVGNDAAAVGNLDNKLEMLELLPAAQCGVVHRLLAVAAERIGEAEMAEYLNKRARLLCTEKQLEGLGMSVVNRPLSREASL